MMEEYNMKFYFAQEYGDDIYFSALEYNGLFRKNINSDYVEYLGTFENEKLLQRGLHSRVFRDGDKLFFLPFNGKCISIYDVVTNKKEYIELPSDVHYAPYVNAVKINDLWLLIPYTSQWKFLWFDIKKMYVKEYDELSIILEEKLGDFCVDMHASFVANEKMYFSFYGTSFIAKFDLKKKEIFWKSFEGYAVCNIEKSGDYLWITTLNGNVIRWREDTSEEYVYELFAKKERPYYYVLSWSGRLFLLPFSEDKIYEYNCNCNNWCSLDASMPEEYRREIEQGLPLVVGYKKNLDSLELYPRSGNGSLIISNGKIEYKSIKNTPEINEIIKGYAQEILMQHIEQGLIVMENEQLRLENCLSFLSEYDG